MEPGLSPQQGEIVERIRRLAAEAASTGRGRVLFVAGEGGSGKSHLVRQASSELLDRGVPMRLATGRTVGSAYSAGLPGGGSEVTAAAESALSTAASIGATLLNPALALVAQIADLSAAARNLLEASEDRTEVTDSIPTLLRAVASEQPSAPLVCLIDDADQLDGDWWTTLQFVLAREIAEGLPLILVLGIDGLPTLGAKPAEGEPIARNVARSLLNLRLAEWRPLRPLTVDGLNAWLGPMPMSLAAAAIEMTGGFAGDICDLWAEWSSRGTIEEDGEGWRSTARDWDRVPYAGDMLTARLSAALGEGGNGDLDEVRELLTCAALEGNTFTAEAAAAACGRDRDEAVDLFDVLAEAPAEGRAVLQELGAVAVEDLTRQETRYLWRYRFVRTSDWRAARERLSTPAERAALAPSLANGIATLYGPEASRVAHVIAGLWRLAGGREGAEYFHRVAYSTTTRAVLRSHCLRLIATDTTGWMSWDYRDAAGLMLAGCRQLAGTWPNSFTFDLARRAGEYAERAGPRGKRSAAEACFHCGNAELIAGRTESAKKYLEAALERSQVGAPSIFAYAQLTLGRLARLSDSNAEMAAAHTKKALEVFRQIGDVDGEGGCLYELAFQALEEGELELALELNEGALSMARGKGDREDEVSCVHQRGMIIHARGDHEQARECVELALRFKREMGKRNDEGACLRLLGSIEWSLGRYDEAWANVDAALALQQEVEDVDGQAASLGLLAQIEIAQGESAAPEEQLGKVARAKQRLREAAEIYRGRGDRVREGNMLDTLRSLG